jgi:nucleotidyltransferase/DNA polymerase involved in DNA repair
MNQVDAIKKTVKELFEKFLSESTQEIRRVGVKVSGFEKQEKEQRSLTDFMQPAKKS